MPWLALLCLLAGPARSETRIVVAVGSNLGLAGEVRLEYAEADARNFTKAMNRLGDVRRARSYLFAGTTASEVMGGLEHVIKQAPEGATIFFYYSGHADEHDLHIMGSRVPLRSIQALMKRSRAKLKIAIVDACRTARSKGGFQSAPSFAIRLDAPEGMKGFVTLRSASNGEASQESDELKGGVYTHYFLNALRGAGDLDRDRRVTLSEAYQYAYRQTVRRSAASSGNVMHPSIDMDLSGTGDLVLTKSRKSHARVVLPAGKDQRYLVFARPSGTLVSEVWSAGDRPTRLAVPSGKYLIHRRASEGGGAYTFSVRRGKEEVVSSEKFHPVPEALLAAKGGVLNIWHSDLRLHLGTGLSHRATTAQHVQVRGGYGNPYWAVSVAFDGGTTAYASTDHDTREAWIGGDLRLDLPSVLWGLHVHAGIAWRVIDQTHTRADAGALALSGTPVESSFLGFGVGPTLGIGYRLALGRFWYGAAELDVGGFVRQEGDRLAFRWRGQLLVGVGLEL